MYTNSSNIITILFGFFSSFSSNSSFNFLNAIKIRILKYNHIKLKMHLLTFNIRKKN